ncbi:MAG: histidine kinase, partial [Frankiales bacterium]|nr:histidine kinase [Frankiales bacterium]
MSEDDAGMTPESLYDQAPCGYLSTSADGTVVRVNQTLLRWIGRDRGDVVGHLFSELLTPSALLFYETHYRALLHVAGRVDGMALDLATVDRAPLPVLVTAEQHLTPDGRPGPVHVSLFSTRSRAVYEQDLRRSRQRAEQSAARLRLLHEVREACQSALEPHDVASALTRSLSRATRGGSVAVWLTDDDGRMLLETGAASAFAPAALSVQDPLPAAEAVRRGAPLAAGPADVYRSWPALAGPLADAG